MTTHTSPVIERLLAQAYDAEQAGDLAIAARLRDVARTDAQESQPAPIERRLEIMRAFDAALGSDAPPASPLDQVRAEITEALAFGGDDTAVEPELWQVLSALDPIVAAARCDAARYTVGRMLDRVGLAAPAPARLDQLPSAPAMFDDDEDARIVSTDTSRPIVVERVEMGRDRAWLDFRLGAGDDRRMLVSTDIVGGRPGCDLVIHGSSVTSGCLDEPALTLDQLRQIHADLGAMLADDRLLGILAAQGTNTPPPASPAERVRAAVLAALAIEDDEAQRAALAAIPNADWEALGTADPIIGAAYHAGGTIAIRDYRRLRTKLG